MYKYIVAKQPSPPTKKKNKYHNGQNDLPCEIPFWPKALPGICVESWLRWDPEWHLSHDESHVKALSSKQLAQHLRNKKKKEWKYWNLRVHFFYSLFFFWGGGCMSMCCFFFGGGRCVRVEAKMAEFKM